MHIPFVSGIISSQWHYAFVSHLSTESRYAKDEGENTYETYFRGIPHIFGELSTGAGAF